MASAVSDHPHLPSPGILLALLDSVLPRRCAACGAAFAAPVGGPVCGECAASWQPCPRLVVPEPAPAGFPPTWALGAYEGVLRQVLLAHKEGRHPVLAGWLAAALIPVLRAVAAGSDPRAGRVIVPVPSRPEARRARRGDPIGRMIRIAARRWAREDGAPVSFVPGLQHVRVVADQAGLSARARQENLTGALGVTTAALPSVRGATVIVVDDILTTGATLTESARALRAAGSGRVQAVVWAATARTVVTRPWPRTREGDRQ